MNVIKTLNSIFKLSRIQIKSVKGLPVSIKYQFQNFCSEADRAKRASVVNALKEGTIFDKIINKEIPADIIYEDDNFLAFNDVNPQAPVHFLVIPKQRIPRLQDATPNDKELLGNIFLIAAKLASKRLPEGYRVVVNNGVNGCQSVYHLHVHVLGGRQMKWPPG